MNFNQTPPALGNQYDDDRVLTAYLARTLPPTIQRAIEPELRSMGRLAGGELYQQQLADRLNEPVLTTWDAWGERVDRIEVTPLWRVAERLAAEYGLVAAGYEPTFGRFARLHQFALVYLFTPSTDIYSCPLAMTDGAARTLLVSGNHALIERAVPHLTSRDPAAFWTSGQWMTELTGGSDVGLSETIAQTAEDGSWRLSGRKWFTSAITSPMALTLARPVGNPPGGKGLALFYVETHDSAGRPNHIQVARLKDKLGTRKVPTAELLLEGTPAQLVMGLTHGVRNMATMLNITRTWNGVSAVSLMRRGIALARDYAGKRVAFGAPLAQKPLHVDTLAGLQAEFEGAFHLTFFVVELLGRSEAGEANAEQAALLRILTPIMKLTTARQAVAVLSEVVEAFGGAGYVEDTGIPTLLRDAQVLSIWEGTTNVLALDALRAVGGSEGMTVLAAEIERLCATAHDARLADAVQAVQQARQRAEQWLQSAASAGSDALEAGARRFALTIGRSLELALLVEQAQWSLEHSGDEHPLAAARRLHLAGVDMIRAASATDASMLATDQRD